MDFILKKRNVLKKSRVVLSNRVCHGCVLSPLGHVPTLWGFLLLKWTLHSMDNTDYNLIKV